MSIVTKIFGDPNVKFVKKYKKRSETVNDLEERIKKISEAELKQKTEEFRKRLKDGEILDAFLPEAFAVVREAARRVLGQRHYDVQLMAGMALHERNIAEMKTGEGKTLAATLALYLNALPGKGAHLITVNDYLARRDADWMGRVFYALGMSVGCIQHQAAYIFDPEAPKMEIKEATEETGKEKIAELSFKVDMNNLRPVSRKEAYAADITYGTNNEFGFDYLRDNMVQNRSDKVQRDLYFAIVDEVDSILIDEARTPLIISAPSAQANEKYYAFARIVNSIEEGKDYNVDEKMRSVALTQEGIDTVEKYIGTKNLYQDGGIEDIHHIEQALKARALFKKDKEYVVKDGEIIIVDEFTGRLMFGRRFSEGLHQAIEAKEGVQIKQESLTLATITLQNLFRLYKKLAGMTGTASTEAEEFQKIYNLDVVSIPTHRPTQRRDRIDRIYKNEKSKFRAVIQDIKARHEQGQPVLVGTISIEKNEILGKMLADEGIPYELLNAKNHEREGQIIAQAGRVGAVTIATNMAGRGVDIVLGGNPPTQEEADKVRAAGGLAVIGTERHESRRIDNQLRGRSGRQGDPGVSQFYVSLEDDLMRIFASDRMRSVMDRLGLPDDMPIENRFVGKSLETAQKKVEGRNFDIRKHLVEYDDIMNKHRDVIYKKRNEILQQFETAPEKIKESVMKMIEDEITHVIRFHIDAQENSDAKDRREIEEVLETIVDMSDAEKTEIKNISKKSSEVIIKKAKDIITKKYEELEKRIGNVGLMRSIEKDIQLRTIDTLWVEHLDQMTRLREGIGLRGYGQQDPLVEYKRESYRLFAELLGAIQHQVAYGIFKIAVHRPTETKPKSIIDQPNVVLSSAEKGEMISSQTVNKEEKIGRNDPCPCGSGKKYKKCHGK